MPAAKTYTLNPGGETGTFYKDLSSFADTILLSARQRLLPFVDDYYNYILANTTEVPRSKEEYLLELVIAGVLVKNYYVKAAGTSSASTGFLYRLYHLRKKHQRLKPIIDRVRGFLSYWLLERKPKGAHRWTPEGFGKLLRWLSATGEFNEEIIRLRTWMAFFETKTPEQFRRLLRSAVFFAGTFEKMGEDALGRYVCNIPQFLQNNLPAYRYREDYFFVSRGRNEYFMNMFGAEILNRHMRDAFKRMPRKAVLLPTCMRTVPPKGCGSQHDGKELVCMQCSRNCNVGNIATAMKKKKVTTYLIPHSSGFSRFLRKWEGNRETGLVGVTCILNLLAGGYEMRRRNISSQCIFLDYCACKKHWDKTGFPTTLNIQELERIVT